MSEFEQNNYENNDHEDKIPEMETREENTDQVIPAETDDHTDNQEEAVRPEPAVRDRYTYQSSSSDYSGRSSYDPGNWMREEGVMVERKRIPSGKR